MNLDEALDPSQGSEVTASVDLAEPKSKDRTGQALLVMVLIVGAMLLSLFAWGRTGGSNLVMETPSMCPSICVGALVLDQNPPADTHELSVGQVITFVPEGAAGRSYTHRIYSIAPDGNIRTKGDAMSDKDPWVIHPGQILGVEKYSIWGLGWLRLVLPFLAVGLTLLLFVRAYLSPQNRRWVTRIWLTILVIAPLWVLKPLLRGEMIGSVPDSGVKNWVTSTIVNTGMLPASFQIQGGEQATLPTTQLANLSGPVASDGYAHVSIGVDLPWWGWVLVVLFVTFPLIEWYVRPYRGASEDLPLETEELNQVESGLASEEL